MERDRKTSSWLIVTKNVLLNRKCASCKSFAYHKRSDVDEFCYERDDLNLPKSRTCDSWSK